MKALFILYYDHIHSVCKAHGTHTGIIVCENELHFLAMTTSLIKRKPLFVVLRNYSRDYHMTKLALQSNWEVIKHIVQIAVGNICALHTAQRLCLTFYALGYPFRFMLNLMVPLHATYLQQLTYAEHQHSGTSKFEKKNTRVTVSLQHCVVFADEKKSFMSLVSVNHLSF